MHRLYDETCAQRWARRKREEELVRGFREEALVHVRYAGLANPAMDAAHPPTKHERLARRRQEDEDRRRSSDDDATPTPFPFPSFSEPSAAPPTALPDPPASIDPGGGSSGGGGASGDY